MQLTVLHVFPIPLKQKDLEVADGLIFWPICQLGEKAQGKKKNVYLKWLWVLISNSVGGSKSRATEILCLFY